MSSTHAEFRSMLQPEDFTPSRIESLQGTRERINGAQMERICSILMQNKTIGNRTISASLIRCLKKEKVFICKLKSMALNLLLLFNPHNLNDLIPFKLLHNNAIRIEP